MRSLLLAALVFVPALSGAQGVQGPITQSRLSATASSRYVFVQFPGAQLTTANGSMAGVYIPWGGRVVDVIFYQQSAGVGGTSYTFDVKTVGGTSLLTTLGVATLASGASIGIDVRGGIATPSGWTRPVLKSDSTLKVAKGDRLVFYTVETGTYSTHASVHATVIIDTAQ